MIDSAVKRFSLLQAGRPWVVILPPPEGTLDEEDRRLLARFYAGTLGFASGVLEFYTGFVRSINEVAGVIRPLDEETGTVSE